MSYHLRCLPDSGTQLWKIESDGARCLDQTDSGVFRPAPGESIWQALRRLTPWFEPDGSNPFHALALRPGEFHPRIIRPLRDHPAAALGLMSGPPLDRDALATARSQLTALTRQLARICQTVHPIDATLDVFGHDIRNLLILTCTEIESHWRAVLQANGVLRERYSTNDYVTLQTAMKLGQYAVAFPDYPWLVPFYPFRGWGDGHSPTQELAWYSAYNAVKHSREHNFALGTLRHLFDAISACAVAVVAQFGAEATLQPGTELAAFYSLASVPTWPPEDVYVYPCAEPSTDWVSAPYPFDQAG